MKIRLKLSLMMIGVTLLCIAVMGVFTYLRSTQAIVSLTENSMKQVNTNKAQTISARFRRSREVLNLLQEGRKLSNYYSKQRMVASPRGVGYRMR